jgi:hypothetical protein
MNIEQFLDLAATCSDASADEPEETEPCSSLMGCLTNQNFIDDSETNDENVPPLNPYMSCDEASCSSGSIPCAQRPTPPRPKKKNKNKDTREPPAINWCFTLNNYSDDEYEKISSLYPEKVKYMIIGKEVGEEDETPHLQGYCQFSPKLRFHMVKQLLGDRCHIEKCKGSAQSNVDYCKKGGIWEEWGECTGTHKQKVREIIKKLQSGESVTKIVDSDLCHSYVVNRQNIRQTLREIGQEAQDKSRKKKNRDEVDLSDWQKSLIELFEEFKDNDRVIFWIYDNVGGAGKTFFCDYMSDINPKDVIVMDNQQCRDISCAYNGQKIVLFDFVREEEHDIKYGVLEKLKNGRIFSAKYESHVKVFEKPTVCVFANHAPRVKMLSMDRWKIYSVTRRSNLVWEDAQNLQNLQEMH